jgi:6-pyruvoyltetrahydropterin/6-carboxytetrahydropterin synthase
LHGYALAFTFTFEAEKLDDRNWVMDFGGLKDLKTWLVENFDHRLLVAKDDPQLALIQALHATKIANVHVVSNVGCEAFAQMAFEHANFLLTLGQLTGDKGRVMLTEVICHEHEGNSAGYRNPALAR